MRWQRRGNHSWWCVPSILMVPRLGRKKKPSRWATTTGQREPLMDKVHATHGRMAQRDPSRKRGDGVYMKTIWFLISLSSSDLSTLGSQTTMPAILLPIICSLLNICYTAGVSSLWFCYENFPSLELRSWFIFSHFSTSQSAAVSEPEEWLSKIYWGFQPPWSRIKCLIFICGHN